MVELRGVEPLASSMRPRRSSQLSYSPEWDQATLASQCRTELAKTQVNQRSPTARRKVG